MFGSQVIDTGIGLAMLFAFMSLIATSLNEAIETMLKARAKQLEQGIRNILDDPKGEQGLVAKFFNDPVINILYDGVYDVGKLVTDKMRPEKAFNVSGDDANNVTTPNATVLDKVKDQGARALRFTGTLPSYIPKSNFAVAVLRMAADNGPQTVADIQTALGPNGTSPLKDTKLGPLILQAFEGTNTTLSQAQTHLEDWYDASMERVTGWYKRRTQFILFFIGLIAAIILNVDAIQVGRSLMTDTSLRQAAIAAAAKQQGNTAVDLEASREAIEAIGLPIGWTKARQFEGIHPDCKNGEGQPDKCTDVMGYVAAWSSMVLGWLITALAIMLGAPLWFDVLNRLMQLRTAIKADDKDKKAKKD